MTNNSWMNFASGELEKLTWEEKDLRKKARMQMILGHLTMGIVTYEEEIELAKMIGARNPEFPGDLVGRPDDDFDDGEDES
jgi:hypothetical protein